MTALTLYLATATIFLLLDALGLRFIVKPIFDRDIGHLMLEEVKLAPAAAFYLFYAGAICWLISWPGLADTSLAMIALNGAVMGAAAYGAYEFSNYATLKGWTPQMLVTDLVWGTLLTALSATAGVAITRAMT